MLLLSYYHEISMLELTVKGNICEYVFKPPSSAAYFYFDDDTYSFNCVTFLRDNNAW